MLAPTGFTRARWGTGRLIGPYGSFHRWGLDKQPGFVVSYGKRIYLQGRVRVTDEKSASIVVELFRSK